MKLLRLRQGQPLHLISSILLPNHLWSLFLFYNQASSFSTLYKFIVWACWAKTQSCLGSKPKLVLTPLICFYSAPIFRKFKSQSIHLVFFFLFFSFLSHLTFHYIQFHNYGHFILWCWSAYQWFWHLLWFLA